MRRLARRTGALVGVLVLVILMSACGDDALETTTTAVTSTSSDQVTTTSSDQVTTTSSEEVTTTTAAPVEPIYIGTLFPLTGPNAVIGTQTYQGVEIARQMINDRGGINGRPIEYIVADAPDPDTAVNEVTRLITQEGVSIVIGTQSSALSFPASAIAEREGVIYWETVATADRITSRGFNYLFRNSTPGSLMGEQQVDALVDYLAPLLGIEIADLRVGLIYEDSAYGMTAGRAAALRAVQRDVPILVEESYTAASTQDFSSLILKLKENNVEVLIGTALVDDTVNLLSQAAQLQFNPKAIMLIGGVGYTTFWEAFGEKTDGVFVCDIPKSEALPDSALTPETLELREEYRARYSEAFGADQLSTNSDLGFQGAWMLFSDVMLSTGSDDPEAIRQAACSLDLPYGSTVLGFGAKFECPGGQNTRALVIVAQWQDGVQVAVYPEQFARGEAINVPLPPWGDQ